MTTDFETQYEDTAPEDRAKGKGLRDEPEPLVVPGKAPETRKEKREEKERRADARAELENGIARLLEGHKPLWPGRWPIRAISDCDFDCPKCPAQLACLIGKRREVGPLVFDREFMCNPRSSVSSLFPLEMFEPMLHKDLTFTASTRNWGSTLREEFTIATGWDFALSEKVGADYTVKFTIAMHNRTGKRQILDLRRWKGISFDRQLHEITESHRRYGEDVIMLETVLFQRLYKNWITSRTALPVLGHDCVDTQTEVLSHRGWLKSHEVTVGDLILTLNTETSRSEWQQVTYLYRGDYDGVMMGRHGRSVDFLVTPDHKWPVFDRDDPMNRMRLEETRLLNQNRVIPRARRMAEHQEPPTTWTDDFVEIVGWAATEGHFASPGKGINIGQSNRANPEKVERIRSVLKRLGAQWSETVNKTTDVQLFKVSGGLARQIRAVTGSRKNLPMEFVMQLPARQRELLMEVLVAGDGWHQSGSTYLTNQEEGIIQAYEAMAAMNGSPTNVTSRMAHRRTGEPTRPQYTVCDWSSNDTYVMNRAEPWMEEEHYAGEIWCPRTVNGTFYARRNGMTYFTGNTGGEKASLEIGIPSLVLALEKNRYVIPYAPGQTRETIDVWLSECMAFGWMNDKLQGVGEHDDTVIAWWLAELALKKARRGGWGAFHMGLDDTVEI